MNGYSMEMLNRLNRDRRIALDREVLEMAELRRARSSDGNPGGMKAAAGRVPRRFLLGRGEGERVLAEETVPPLVRLREIVGAKSTQEPFPLAVVPRWRLRLGLRRR